MDIVFLVIAIVFLVLWQLEKRKSTTVKNLEVERAAARSYVEDRKAEGDALLEEKRREALDYYCKKTKSAD